VTEVPLLYEVGGDARFDAVVVISAAQDVRVSRQVRPMQDRERRLIPDEEKLSRADFAYVNDGSLEELDQFVSGVVEKLSA
jgi:dephospho-CoA kinase